MTKATCPHRRPWFAQCLSCEVDPEIAAATWQLPFWRAMSRWQAHAYGYQIARAMWSAGYR